MEGGTLTINGTIRVNPVIGNTLQVGDSIRIFTANKFMGTPTIENIDGIEWDDSRIAEGLLFVKTIDTAIKPQIANGKSQKSGIFDLNGRRLSKAQKGITIVKKVMSDGSVKTEKVIVK